MKSRTERIAFAIGAACVVLAGVMQLKQPAISHPPVTGELSVAPEISIIIKRACYDCHSNETRLQWYDQIAPVSWQVAEHVISGREHLNFSEWDKLTPSEQKAKLWESVNQINAGAMPLKSYATVHPLSQISSQELTLIRNYLESFTGNRPNDTAKLNARNKQYELALSKKSAVTALPKTLNGIEFIPDYKNWLPISTTERFDNGTLRVIYGNNVAIEAVKNHRINPWPEGTILAKVAWDQIEDNEGNITTGAFKQVEYMIKDTGKYTSTNGWGFARFKTPAHEPYGNNILIANECMSCHRPLRDNDFVFTQPINF